MQQKMLKHRNLYL